MKSQSEIAELVRYVTGWFNEHQLTLTQRMGVVNSIRNKAKEL